MNKKISQLLIIFAMFFLFPTTVFADDSDIVLDEAHFPDANFRAAVSEAADTDKDGILSQEETDAISKLDVSSQQIYDLTGISYFQNLTALSCRGNNLKALNTGKMEHLTYLDCSHNSIAVLDLSQFPALNQLRCISNPILNLDFSNNVSLQKIELGGHSCPTLELTHIGTQNPMLDTISCRILDTRELNLHSFAGLDPENIISITGAHIQNNIIRIDGSYVSEEQYPVAELICQFPGKEIPVKIRLTSTLKHLVGWIQDENGWKYENGDGTYPTNEWKQIDRNWYYFNSDGYRTTGWNEIENRRYYMNQDGIMLTGWQYIDGSWYYMSASGAMQTGWQYIGRYWYLLDSSGRMKTGWVWTDNAYSYFDGAGHMQTGWQYIDGYWYFFSSSGYMRTGWAWTDGAYSYFDANGHMQTGWQYIDGYWYFLSSSGYMQTGWQQINGQHYYFDGSGHMLRNTWVGNYYLGSDGAWKTDLPHGSKRFYVAVNCQENTVTIYERDSHGYYTIPYKAMVCSSGLSYSPTPKGTFRPTGNRWKWLRMVGDVWGIYVTQIRGNYLFHSVPYTEYGNHGSLQEGEFDKLGQPASHGCIRLQVKDAKWIYDNMSNIDTIKIFDSPDPGPLGKPTAPKIGNSSYPGWDPTDTDPKNPWLNVAPPRATCADLAS